MPKDITISYDTKDLKEEDDFLILDRSFAHMKHPLPKEKADPTLEKRTVRA